MKNEENPSKVNEQSTRYYLLFDALQKQESGIGVSDPTLDEIDEIERMGRIVSDIVNDPVRFTTST